MKAGDLVPWARPGARVPVLDRPLEAKPLRGEISNGMLCSPRELAVSHEHETGILLLPDDLTIGADLRSTLGLDDVVLDLEVESNRPDLLSITGIAREVAGATGEPLIRPDITVGEVEEPASTVATVEIEDLAGMPALPRADRARDRSGTDADPRPGAAHRLRSTADLSGRRRHEPRDVGPRSATACVRPPAARRSRHRRAAIRGGRTPRDARRRRPRARRRSADLRRRTPGRDRGRDGRRIVGGRSRNGRRAPRERVLRATIDPAHVQAPPAPDGGIGPLLTGNRPRRRWSRSGAGRRADRGVDRGRGAEGRGRRRRTAAAASDRAPFESRRRRPRIPRQCGSGGAGAREDRDRRGTGRRPRRGGGAELPTRPRAGGGSDRGGRADPGLRPAAVHRAGAPRGRRRARELPDQAPRPGAARPCRAPGGRLTDVRFRLPRSS